MIRPQRLGKDTLPENELKEDKNMSDKENDQKRF